MTLREEIINKSGFLTEGKPYSAKELANYQEFSKKEWTPKTLYEFAKEHGFEDAIITSSNNIGRPYDVKSIKLSVEKKKNYSESWEEKSIHIGG